MSPAQHGQNQAATASTSNKISLVYRGINPAVCKTVRHSQKYDPFKLREHNHHENTGTQR